MNKITLTAALLAPLTLPTLADRLPPSLLEGKTQKADIALMPGWEFKDVNEAAALCPTVIAWGEDAIWGTAPLIANGKKYAAMGVGMRATNVWMLTATKEHMLESDALFKASCVDIELKPIVPSWLDGEKGGMRDYWGCTNQPAFREQLMKRALDGISTGANMLHLDDHMGTAAAAEHGGGCFCHACMRGFNHWLAENYTKQQLADLGINKLAEFNYRDFLTAQGITSREIYDKKLPSLPLRKPFLAFQQQAIRSFIAELKTAATKAAGEPVPLGINAWNLQPYQLSNTHLADYFSNELEHYDVESNQPPFVYKLGDALGRPVYATATGEDWTKINKNKETERVRSWLEISYAFGHQFMYAFRQWAFDASTGTNWYEPEVEVYKPVTDFVSNNARLLNAYQPVANLGLVYSNSDFAQGRHGARSLSEWLHKSSFQFRLLVAGDDLLLYQLEPSDADGLDYICLPEDLRLSGAQGRVIQQWRKQGRAGSCNNVQSIPAPRIEIEGANNVWALLKRNDSGKQLVHLLNNNRKQGKAQALTGIDVQLPRALVTALQDATLHSRHAPPVSLKIEKNSQGYRLKVPTLQHWAIIELE